MDIFSGSEIVEIGIQIEKNGRDFYNTLVRPASNPKAKEIFKYLSGEEERHIIAFQKILGSIEKYEPAESYSDEYFKYMNALASQHIFTQENKGSHIAKQTKDDKEAVNLGIGFEKDSIIFYEGMKKVVPAGDLRIVEELILEEQNHLTQLTALEKTLEERNEQKSKDL